MAKSTKKHKELNEINSGRDEAIETISMLAEIDSDGENNKFEGLEGDAVLPILPLRNTFLFPVSILSVSVGRESSLNLIHNVAKDKGYIGVFCQKRPDKEEPTLEELYEFGTLAKIIRIFEMPDDSTTVVLQGLQRIKIKDLSVKLPYIMGTVTPCNEYFADDEKAIEFEAILRECRNNAETLFKTIDPPLTEAAFAISNLEEATAIINFLCANIRSTVEEKFMLISESNMMERCLHVSSIINHELRIARLLKGIRSRTHEELDMQQREYYLQQQMKVIQDELGGSVQEQDIAEMRQKALNKKWSKNIVEIFEKELSKLERINPQTPDYHVQLNYLQVMLSLPWGEYTKDNLDINNAKKVLDRDHYGLEKVKERILEHLAVIKMRGDLKAPIICLYGPPGVGKTSLGKSIAEALKRKYVRMSLGGIHDESEIRGHRKTYVGAMPGRILKNLIKAGSDNPVFILDEIDKVGGSSMHGDPSSALLEVLDPEQNNAFHDNFLDIDYDLSKVMFIATANDLAGIPAPLLDRMELIEVSGYLTEEKIEIARHHLVPKELEANGIAGEKITIRKNAIERIIEDYTRESGVRTLEKKIGKIFRRLACQKATNGEFSTKTVKQEDLKELLGPKEFSRDKYQGNDYAGVVVGLAWTAVGGEILFIETSLSPGKESHLTLTGNLGDVMKESAMLALEYIKAHASLLNIDNEIFQKWSVHLHVPEGAIPKDGPSAGITMATALASAFTQRKVKPNLAMTGEITLRGKVLPVGGIKEKILAAKRAGIKEIIICEENRKDIEVIPEIYVSGLTFHYVKDIKEVLDIALLKEKVKNAINL